MSIVTRMGVVTAIAAGPPRSCTVTLEGTSIAGMRAMEQVRLGIGQSVWIADSGSGDMLIVGAVDVNGSNPEIGPWVDMVYEGAWTSADGGNSRPALQIREEGPYIRVRGTAVMPSGGYPSRICQLPPWAIPYGSQIIPVCCNSSSSSRNFFGSIRLYNGSIYATSNGGASTNTAHYLEFRYLRRPAMYQTGAAEGPNYLSVFPWTNYAIYSEWLAPGLNLWNGQTTAHGLAADGTAPTSNIMSIFNGTNHGTRGGATEILFGWSWNTGVGQPSEVPFRADVSSGTYLAAQLIANNTWISHARMEWVNNGSPSPARTAATLTNSWTNYGAGYQNAGYVKIDDVVFISGLVLRGANGNDGSSIFTLPAGFRPQYTTRIPVIGTIQNQPAGGLNLVVYTDGTVKNDSGLWGDAQWISLSGVNFSTS